MADTGKVRTPREQEDHEKRMARRRKRREQQRDLGVRSSRIAVYGLATADTDPAEVMLNEIRRTSGHIQWLGMQLARSDPEMFIKSFWLKNRTSGWVRQSEIDMNDWSQAGAIWLDLYMSERRHLAGVLRTALAAGIEERRVRLAERLAERVGDAISGILYDLGIDPEDDRVREVIYKWLTQAQDGKAQPPPVAMAIEGNVIKDEMEV